jgi:hypothetical protein
MVMRTTYYSQVVYSDFERFFLAQNLKFEYLCTIRTIVGPPGGSDALHQVVQA